MSNTWDLEQPLGALRKSVDHAFTLTRKNAGTSIPYDGPMLSSFRLLACSYQVTESMSAEGLAEHEKRGRDAMDVILLVAFQLGMEQGWRSIMDDLPIDRYEMRHLRLLTYGLDGPNATLDELVRRIENPGRVRIKSATEVDS